MRLNGTARDMVMNDDYELYDARAGFETHARYIRQNLKDQETWGDMVRGAEDLCNHILNTPACRENPHVCELLINVVISVLLGSENFFGKSDKVRELALVISTKKQIMNAISWIEGKVDESYPETVH